MNIRMRLIIPALVLFVSLSGCIQSERPEEVKIAENVTHAEMTPAGTSEIRIGLLQSLTGDLGAYGGPMSDAARLAVKEVNANGGVMGRQVRLIAEDDQSSNIAAVDAANKLLKVDRVPVIIGATGSGPSMSIIDICIKSGALQISSSNTGVEFTSYNDSDLYFRTAPSDALQGAAMAKFARELGHMTASTLVINNPYGKGFEEVFTEKFESLGGEVIQTVRYNPTQTIFGSEVDKAFALNPDIVILVSYPATGSLILKTAYEKGLLKNSSWLLSEGLMIEKLAEMVGKDKDGRYVAAGLVGLTLDPSAGGDAHQAFRERYVSEYGREPGMYGSNTYDATAVVLLAMEKAGDASGSAISKNIRAVANPGGVPVSDLGEALRLIREGKEIDYQGTSGEIAFDEHGDVCGAFIVCSVADNGTIAFGEKISV